MSGIGESLVLLANCGCFFGWSVIGGVVAARLAGQPVGALIPAFPKAVLGDGVSVWESGAPADLISGGEGWNTVAMLVIMLEGMCLLEVLRMLVGTSTATSQQPSRQPCSCAPQRCAGRRLLTDTVLCCQGRCGATQCWASVCTTPGSSSASRSSPCSRTALSPTPSSWPGAHFDHRFCDVQSKECRIYPCMTTMSTENSGKPRSNLT
jgi:hypothetical protein